MSDHDDETPSSYETGVVRGEAGRWVKPPRSPGRPVGPTRAEKIATFLEPHLEGTLTKLAELAKLGDGKSAELLLKYVAPPARPDAERVQIPGFSDAPDLKSKAEAVLAAAATGHCSAEAAQKLLAVLDVYARAVHATEMEERLAALEAGRGAPKPVTIDGQTGQVLPDQSHEDLA